MSPPKKVKKGRIVRPGIRALRVSRRGLEIERRRLRVASRVAESYPEVEVSKGLVGLEGDGLAVGLVCTVVILVGHVACALCQQPIVPRARALGCASLPLLCNLAVPLLLHPTRVLVLPPSIFLHVPDLVLGPGLSLAVPAAKVYAHHVALGAQGAARVVTARGRRLVAAKAVQAGGLAIGAKVEGAMTEGTQIVYHDQRESLAQRGKGVSTTPASDF